MQDGVAQAAALGARPRQLVDLGLRGSEGGRAAGPGGAEAEAGDCCGCARGYMQTAEGGGGVGVGLRFGCQVGEMGMVRD